jgi:SAM-dependent methyltransferase
VKPADDYADVHTKRYQKSLEWIAPIADKAEKILDLGGVSPFTKLLQERWPGKLMPYLNADLRQLFIVKDCDLILCMECLEHIPDCEDRERFQHRWTGTGTESLLASCWMSLKPGGHLFLTTPNCCSITAIHHALNLTPPMIYRPHFREYAPYEVDEMIRAIGFEIVRRETLDVWRNAISMREHAGIKRFIEEENYPAELRGEDVFVLAKRPIESKTSA